MGARYRPGTDAGCLHRSGQSGSHKGPAAGRYEPERSLSASLFGQSTVCRRDSSSSVLSITQISLAGGTANARPGLRLWPSSQVPVQNQYGREKRMTERTLRGQVVIAGIGETPYYKHGQSPDSEFKLALMAILAAARDAGIDPKDIDGFASYSNDRSDPSRLAAALGTKELRFSNMQWGGGGGGVAAAVGNAAAAVASGMANCVVAFRSLAQGQFARFGRGSGAPLASGDDAFAIPYGVLSTAQKFAMKVVRFMHDHGVKQEALRAISMVSYYHAQNNPRAVMYGRPLDEAKYDASRWIVE